MSQVTGKARIRINGKPIDSMDGAELDPGGDYAESKVSSHNVHRKEKLMQSKLTCKIPHTADVSLGELRAMRDVSVLFEPDSGAKSISIPKMWTVAAKLSGDEVALEMEGEPGEEL